MQFNDISNLKKSLFEIIKDDEFDSNDLKNMLSPLEKFVDGDFFKQNIGQLVDIILTDRDGNDQFNIKDIQLLSKDIRSITSLVSGILLTLNAIPGTKLKYDRGATEELIFKVFVYIFMVIIPEKTQNKWLLEEKECLIECALTIYQLVLSSAATKELLKKIANWFKKKGFCKCINGSSQEQNELVVEKRMPQIKQKIFTNIQNNKDKIILKEEIDRLSKEVKELKEKI